MIFDSHAHYDDHQYDVDREAVLAGLREAGVGRVVNIGASIRNSHNSVELAAKYDWIYASVGVHPEEILSGNDADYAWMEEEARTNPKVVAIGECGFDYHWLPSKDEDLKELYGTDEHMKSLQKQCFVRQIEMAKRLQMPLVVHSRDAAQDTYQTMKECEAEKAGGVIHCFSYSVEEAKKYLDMGFYIGIGGVLTFKNANKLKQVCEYVPMDRILLETDCPYMAPEPNRGKRNDSGMLPYVVREMARIKGLDTMEVVRQTEENACKMYGLETVCI